MRTLYVRIFITTIGIMIASALLAFIVTNIYYHFSLKPENDKKITNIAENSVAIYEENDDRSADDYFSTLTDLGYQFYIVDQEGNTKMYGVPFRTYELPSEEIERVLNGEIYHGIANYPWKLFVTGFFNNKLSNTVGVPFEMNGKTHALFVRPDTNHQFGEMRIFIVVLLVLALLFSFLLVLVSTTFIVRPIKKLTDATKKIAAGNYHLKLNVNRQDEIGRLAYDFTKMSSSLALTEEKRQEFVSNVSHEIQSPLTSIQGFSQALREEELSDEMRVRYLSIIESETKRLSALSKQLLTLSTLEREGEEIEQTFVNISKQLKEVISVTEWQWREKDIVIEMDIEEGYVTGDAGLLQQVWMNLITNAIRYSDEGGKITVQLKNKKENVNVYVKDTGIGIAKDQIPHLFDRFFKVDKARIRTENSTGLGLAIVKKIIELHQGTIMIESKPGEGSVFQVILPK
ncbi:HAMP domain-containing histidine kinase [Virgibacillus sp. MSJ-26]|uniref:HAMP domain-containing sensor histidine kinase n=1 Tax=Virgibacillus sp. MSJ-26 TaxID=2841522 RepID=UPI001C10E377|nr:HAMP domain-containing sensor histidine kinase [Virgibacillus sp. MSJ-26]MBU5466857.1 HAMP domain-containing histidine kinase [Virgibacillus sp. MSJ-26]